MNQSSPLIQRRELFDRKFVFAAVLIGLAYSLVVTLASIMLGKETAGVIGVALSAIAMAIFKQFETLRFIQADDSARSVYIPRLKPDFLLLVTMALFGCEAIGGVVMGILLAATGNLNSPEDLFSKSTGLLAIIIAKFLSIFVGGFLAGSVAMRLTGLTYSYIFIGAFIAVLLNSLLVAVPTLIVLKDIKLLGGIFGQPIFALNLLWLCVPLAGARLAASFRSKNQRQAIGESI